MLNTKPIEPIATKIRDVLWKFLLKGNESNANMVWLSLKLEISLDVALSSFNSEKSVPNSSFNLPKV